MAHFWFLKPSEFWESSLEDRIYMKAYMETHYEVKAIDDYELEKTMERQSRKSKKR